MSPACFLMVGSPVETLQGPSTADPGADVELEFRGYKLAARARKGAVGWMGELCIFLSPPQSPVHAFYPVGRFHMDPQGALHEALLEGILRVERGEVIAL